jgi:hypothetical protein
LGGRLYPFSGEQVRVREADREITRLKALSIKAFLAERTGLEVSWVRDFHPPGTDDPTWLKAFADEGGYAILSGDARILQHWPNLIAYIESG